MAEYEKKKPYRVVWLSTDQRNELWDAVETHLKKRPNGEGAETYSDVLAELTHVAQRKRVTGRLLEGHVTGLLLPHDALPVRITEEEADALIRLRRIKDRRMRRLLKPGPMRRGIR